MNESPPKKALEPLSSPVSPEGHASDSFKTTKSPPLEQRAARRGDETLSKSTHSVSGLNPLSGISSPAEAVGGATALDQKAPGPRAVKDVDPAPPVDGLDNAMAKPKRPPPKLSSARPKPGSAKSMTVAKTQDGDLPDSGDNSTAPASDSLDNTVSKPKRPPPKFLSARAKTGSGKPMSTKNSQDTDASAVEATEGSSPSDALDTVVAKPKGPPPKLSSARPKPGSVESDSKPSTAGSVDTGVQPVNSLNMLDSTSSTPKHPSPKLSSSRPSPSAAKGAGDPTAEHQSDPPDTYLNSGDTATLSENVASASTTLEGSAGKLSIDAVDGVDADEPTNQNMSPTKERLGVTFSTPIEEVKIIENVTVPTPFARQRDVNDLIFNDDGDFAMADNGGPKPRDIAATLESSELAHDLFAFDEVVLPDDLVPHGDVLLDRDALVEGPLSGAVVRSSLQEEAQDMPVSMDVVDGIALYENISFMRPHGFTENALKVAVMKEDLIAVEMLLSELGSNGPSEILLRDGIGRNCIHVAVMGTSASSDKILLTLLTCFSKHSLLVLKRDIVSLETQYQSSVIALAGGSGTSDALKPTAATGLDATVVQSLSQYSSQSAHDIIYNWYLKERERIKRRTEFAIEMWWLKAVTARDVDGRTPLHYVAMVNNTEKAVCLLTSQCRGRFTLAEIRQLQTKIRAADITDRFGCTVGIRTGTVSSHNDKEAKHTFLKGHYSKQRSATSKENVINKKVSLAAHIIDKSDGKDLLRPNMHYNTLTGEEVGEYLRDGGRTTDSSTSGENRFNSAVKTPLVISGAKSPKSNTEKKCGKTMKSTKSGNVFDQSAVHQQLSASLRMREEIESSQAFVDYEVIIPWVLRNMLRRATDLAANTRAPRSSGDKKSCRDICMKPGDDGPNVNDTKDQAVELLKELFEDCAEAEKNYVHLREDGSDPLYVSENGLNRVLDRLGVRVTADVIREVSVRYQYFGKVENAISEFDFDDYTDEYDEITEELLLESPPKIAEKKKSYSGLPFNISTRGDFADDVGNDDSSTNRLSKTMNTQNRFSSSNESSHLRRNGEFNSRKHTPSESKLNKTWHNLVHPRSSSKSDRGDSFDDTGKYAESDDREYDENFDRNKDMRRQLARSRQHRVGDKLKEIARTVYVNVDSLLEDILTGSGLQSISMSLPSQPGARAPGDNISERRRNLVRAVFQNTSRSGSDTYGVLSVDTNEGFEYLYGDNSYIMDDNEIKPPDNTIKQIEIEMNEDSQQPLQSVISVGGVASYRRKAVNATDRFGCTPLHLAAASGHRDVVNAFISEGADVTASFLVSYAKPQTVRQDTKPTTNDDDEDILTGTDRKANKHLVKPTSITPLSIANGPGVKSILTTALANRLEQLKGRRLASSERMLSGGRHGKGKIHTGAELLPGETTGSFANETKEYELLTSLSQLHGHKFNLSRPALSWAVSIIAVTTVEQLLLSLHANPNAKDAVGRTPLHECCTLASSAADKAWTLTTNQDIGQGWGELRTIADMLLEAGADPTATSVAGRAPLHELFTHPAKESRVPVVSSSSSNSRHTSSTVLYTGPSVSMGRSSSSALKERRAVLRSLLHWGADIVQPDRNQGLTPLHYCAREDSTDCMLELLSYLYVQSPPSESARDYAGNDSTGTDKCGPYIRCINGRTCLHTACLSSSFNAIKLLSRWDADSSVIGSVRMCMMLTTTARSSARLVDDGLYDEYSLTTLRDCNGKTPAQLLGQSGRDESIITLWERCFSGDISRVDETVRALRGKVYDTTSDGRPQWEGVNESDTLFMTENASVTKNKQNAASRDADSKADSKESSDVRPMKPKPQTLNAALSAHSDIWSLEGVDSKTRVMRWTALHCCVVGWACAASLGSNSVNANLCARRVLRGAPPNKAAILSKKLYKNALRTEVSGGSKFADGNKLRVTSSGGFSGMSHAKGTVRNLKGRNKESAMRDDTLVRNNIFCCALKEGKHQEVTLALIKHGAFVNSLDCKARTPLMIAAACNLLDAIALLVEAGADATLKDNIGGNTALHYAYCAGSMAAASLLEELGADANAVNNQGQTPIEVTGLLSTIGSGIFSSA